jgi:branched-chain amino acid transport system substrate-binding protein
MRLTRRKFAIVSGAALTAAGIPWARAAGPPDKIRIGYAISLNGPFTQAAATTTLPNYRLWIHDVNARGGIMVKQYGKRLPIDVVEYDDGSSQENAIRLTEKLISDDKVDFALPPWGTGMNVAVAPIYKKHGYPQLATTSIANGLAGLARQFPTMFFFLAESVDYVAGLTAVLSKLKAAGKINNKIAMLSVSDQFGTELAAAADPGFKDAGFEIVLDRSYAVEVKDLSNELKEAQASGADTFAAFSYPSDTFMITAIAQSIGYSPKVFYTGVGTAFSGFSQKFGAKAEGILGIGGWDSTTQAAKDFVKRHVEVTGQQPDRWASPEVYSSLECLEQAIEAAGVLDREKVVAALRTNTFHTVVGDLRLNKQIRGEQFLVGQWHDGEFSGIEPAEMHGARDLLFPKSQW